MQAPGVIVHRGGYFGLIPRKLLQILDGVAVERFGFGVLTDVVEDSGQVRSGQGGLGRAGGAELRVQGQLPATESFGLAELALSAEEFCKFA
jgi:hypothetical protein